MQLKQSTYFNPAKLPTRLPSSLTQNIQWIQSVFPIELSFDLISRKISFQNTEGFWIGINGLCNLKPLQDLFDDLQDPSFFSEPQITNLQKLLQDKIGYVQSEICSDPQKLVHSILSGAGVLFLDGFSSAVIIDTRSYPLRSIEEPDTERVTRGARDGFIENLLSNANLIRRRIHTPALAFELYQIGQFGKTDVSISYVNGLADESLLHTIRMDLKRLADSDISALTLGSKSLEELLVPKKSFHPLPSLFSTERPDVACSYLLEGYILLLVDNSPSVLVLPGTIFQFTQSPEDDYKSPSVGTMNRLMRFFCILVSLFLLPLFLLLGSCYQLLPDWLSGINADQLGPIRLWILILFTEFGFHLFRYACAHSSSRFSGPMSIVGGLILSEVAINLKWTSLEVIFYSAVTLLASLAISSIEFSDALRLYRLLQSLTCGFGLFLAKILAPDNPTLLLTGGSLGLFVGFILMLVSAITTPVYAKKSYFWPLVPYEKKALKSLLFRANTSHAQPNQIWKR